MRSMRTLGTHFKQGEVIFQQGETADCMYVVLSGEVEIVMETDFGANRLVIKKKGDIFGEISLFACKSRFATARALKDCSVLKVDENTFVANLHQDPSLAFRTIQSMARRIYDQDHLLMSGFFHQEESCCDITGFTSYIDLAAFLDAEVKRARRLMQPMAFAILDMDDYAQLCKKHGEQMGEDLLKVVAACLKKFLRRSDIVGRYSNDRFAILLYEADGVSALKVMEKVRLSYLEQVEEMGVDGLVSSFTCGIAIYPEHEKAVGLSKAAFKSLTQGKLEGKNRVVMAGPSSVWQEKMAEKKEKALKSQEKRPGWKFGFFNG
ncbi:MAG: GGDEF domain-containing protein [Magnetococcales bacterium]|nr:GGDEF domain-containing protein [Magnetococcales bacterium]